MKHRILLSLALVFVPATLIAAPATHPTIAPAGTAFENKPGELHPAAAAYADWFALAMKGDPAAAKAVDLVDWDQAAEVVDGKDARGVKDLSEVEKQKLAPALVAAAVAQGMAAWDYQTAVDHRFRDHAGDDPVADVRNTIAYMPVRKAGEVYELLAVPGSDVMLHMTRAADEWRVQMPVRDAYDQAGGYPLPVAKLAPYLDRLAAAYRKATKGIRGGRLETLRDAEAALNEDLNRADDDFGVNQ